MKSIMTIERRGERDMRDGLVEKYREILREYSYSEDCKITIEKWDEILDRLGFSYSERMEILPI